MSWTNTLEYQTTVLTRVVVNAGGKLQFYAVGVCNCCVRINLVNKVHLFASGVQLGGRGRWGRAPPPAFHTLAKDISLNTQFTSGLWPCIISSFLFTNIPALPSQIYPVAPLNGSQIRAQYGFVC